MSQTRKTPRRRGQTGIALLEVLVSVLLFSLGLLGLIGLQARAVTFSVDAEDRNRAAMLANELVAQMWLMRTTTLSPDAVDAWQQRVKDPKTGGLPNGEGTVAADGAGKANVTITWQAPSRSTGSQLKTHVELPL
jgi:type IV pilus assembly protein PilV